MIFINRADAKIPISLDLTNYKSPAYREREKLLNKYPREIKNRIKKIRSNNSKERIFKAYGLLDVREALKKLFHNKCGYCETKISSGASLEIEHFRPKNRIDVEKNIQTGCYEPGYYWLAMDWDNLLLSCPHCNKSIIHIKGEKATGKSCYFPLAEGCEHKRHKSFYDDPNIFEEEEKVRLLINPCKDIPEENLKFLVYDKNELAGFVAYKTIKGKVSIDAYGLNRPELHDDRKKFIISKETIFSDVFKDLDEALFLNDDFKIQKYTYRLSKKIRDLIDVINSREEEYLAFCVEFIKEKAQYIKKNYNIEISLDILKV